MSHPEKIQEILTTLNSGKDYSCNLRRFTTPRGCHLTNALCSSNKLDFISIYNDDAYLFIHDKKTNTWEVKYIGTPVYHVEPGMISDSINFNSFLNELRCELPGVEIKRGSALSNLESEFVQHFNAELNRAVQSALNNL